MKFSYNFVLLICILAKVDEDSSISHEHLAFFLLLSYSENKQFS